MNIHSFIQYSSCSLSS